MSSEAVLDVEGLDKTFGTTRVLHRVDLRVRPGEVHALVGGNGSGKSTLIKVLAGVHRGDGGAIRIGTTAFAAAQASPALARDAGLRFVHQDPGVFTHLTVAENLAVGGARGFPTRAGGIRWRTLRRRAAELLERFEIEARPDDRLADLRQSDRTMIAIARALQDSGVDGPAGEAGAGAGPSVLVLDEPTASLPEHEVGTVLSAVRRCAREGRGVVYVSHRLDEVVSTADVVTVLRDGRVVERRDVAGLTTDALVEAIVGRPLAATFAEHDDPAAEPQAGPHAGEVLLEVTGLRGGPLVDVDLTVRRGEIVGIAGLLGSGRTELLRQIFGADRREHGRLRLSGSPYDPRSTREAVAAGVAFVPENRAVEAAYATLSVVANLTIARLDHYRRGVRLRQVAERDDAASDIARFTIRGPHPGAPLSELSGGNQQKVVLARWLARSPQLLLLDEPTQGVDVSARADLYRAIRDATDGGMGALLVTSDFEELAHAADRVLVLRHGRIKAEVPRGELSARRLTDLLYVEEPA